MKKKSQFLSVNVIIFFSACILLFLINQLYSVLQVSLILKSTGSVFLLSSVMTAMVVPRIFILPVSGFLTDRLGIFKTLIIGSGLLGTLLVSLFLVNRMNMVNENLIFLFAVLFGGISAAILPALYSAIPALVDGAHLQKANSVMQFINQGTTLAGPLIAGILVEKAGGDAYPIMAAAAVAALFLFFKVKYGEYEERKEDTKKAGTARQGSFRSLFHLPVLVMLLVFTAILNLCIIGPQQVGFPMIALASFPEGVDGYPKLLSVTGLGSLISAVFVGNMKRKQPMQSVRLILWCSLALGLLWSIFSFSTQESVILGSLFTAGLLLGIINVLFITAIQQLTPDFLVGRVMSIQFLCSAGLQPVSYMITGLLLDRFSISHLYLISGGTIVLISMLLFSYKNLQSDTEVSQCPRYRKKKRNREKRIF